jgi:hypothetical protein
MADERERQKRSGPESREDGTEGLSGVSQMLYFDKSQ